MRTGSLLLTTALILIAVPAPAQEAPPESLRCVERHLEELGYSALVSGTRGEQSAERRVLTSLGLAKEAGRAAAWLSMQFRPPVEREFDQLTVAWDPGADPGLRVVAARVLDYGARRVRVQPRARALKDAFAIMTRCGAGGPGRGR